MKATQELRDLGQSLWLDNITRDMLDNGKLKNYIDEFSQGANHTTWRLHAQKWFDIESHHF